MGLFNFGNKKIVVKSSNSTSKDAVIKILGGGCQKCNQLENNTVEALKQLGMDTDVDHITDFSVIATYGVMQTPALVYKNKVLCYGKVIKTDEIIKLIKKEI